MPNKLRDPVRHKFDKAKYKVSNFREYDLVLKKSRGGQTKYSNFAIETCVTLGSLFKQRLRQTEGFVESIITLLKLDLDTPDFTTIYRRMTKLEVVPVYKSTNKPAVVAIDSTGIKTYGEQEWQKKNINPPKLKRHGGSCISQ